MPIQRHNDQVNRLTTFTATGEVTPREFMEVVGAFKNDPPELNILWEFRDALPSESFNANRTEEIALLGKPYVGSRLDGKTAYVATSELVFGICTRFTLLLEKLGTFHQTKVFRDINEALKWLEVGN